LVGWLVSLVSYVTLQTAVICIFCSLLAFSATFYDKWESAFQYFAFCHVGLRAILGTILPITCKECIIYFWDCCGWLSTMYRSLRSCDASCHEIWDKIWAIGNLLPEHTVHN